METMVYKVTISNGMTIWEYKNKVHREGGPAMEFADGTTAWLINGRIHREGGPALVRVNGAKFWYIHGNLHREGGPAIEWDDGGKEWFLNGKRVTEEAVMGKKAACEGLVIEIDQVKYKLQTM